MSTSPTQAPIRVLIIDDHVLFRSGISALLKSRAEIALVGEASDGAIGLAMASETKPDVILLDLHMPGTGGLPTLQLLRARVPAAAVLMLTVSEEAEDLALALHAGACGYLVKNIDVNYLVDAICRAAGGETVVADAMAGKLAENAGRRQAPIGNLGNLTPREREILLRLAAGESNKVIARSLDLAENTVKIHVQNTLRKLNMNSRVQAAVFAIEHKALLANADQRG